MSFWKITQNCLELRDVKIVVEVIVVDWGYWSNKILASVQAHAWGFVPLTVRGV